MTTFLDDYIFMATSLKWGDEWIQLQEGLHLTGCSFKMRRPTQDLFMYLKSLKAQEEIKHKYSWKEETIWSWAEINVHAANKRIYKESVTRNIGSLKEAISLIDWKRKKTQMSKLEVNKKISQTDLQQQQQITKKQFKNCTVLPWKPNIWETENLYQKEKIK